MLESIIEEDIPAFYEIGTDNQGAILKVLIHNKVKDDLRDILSNPHSPLIGGLQEEFQLPSFVPPVGGKEGGFGNVLKIVEGNCSDWTELNCPLPQRSADKLTPGDVKNLRSVSATLRVLFTGLNILDTDTGYHLPQLMTLNVFCRYGFHGGSIEGDFSRRLINWFSRGLSEQLCREIVSEMRNADKYIDKRAVPLLSDVRVSYSPPKWVTLYCAGTGSDLVDLGPVSVNDVEDLGSGYSISSHNCDGPHPQLVLLMGLAKMHDLARQAGY